MTDLQHRHQPTGVGVYVSEISQRGMGTPEQAARRCADHGVSFVALLACWQNDAASHIDSNRADLAADRYAAAFREAGIDVWVWGYPWGAPSQITRFVQRMREAASDAGAVGVILDPELGFKGEGARYTRDLVDQTIDSLNESLGLIVTSYPIPQWHPDMAWDVLGGVGCGSPQTYSVDPATASRAVAAWRALGWKHIVQSVPTFGDRAQTAQHLASYIDAIDDAADALCFWQWSTTNNAEWDVIKAVAERFARKAAR